MRARLSPPSSTPVLEHAAEAPSHRELENLLRPRGNPASARPQAQWSWTRLGKRDVLAVAALFSAALLVRWPLIDRGETLLHSDEAIVGIMAQDIAAGRSKPVFFYGQRYMGALEAYVVAGLLGLVNRPIVALRLAPALFFAAMVGVQYAMLTRWRGRVCGLAGGLVLLASSPMFAQWSISARGGYVEILLWGTLLLWAYTEWWIGSEFPAGPSARRRFLFGVLIGSGLWINPSIIVFLLPIALHALLAGPMAAIRAVPAVDRALQQLGAATLLVLALGAVLLLNLVHSVSVDRGRVESRILLGLLPKPVAILVVGLAVGSALFMLQRRCDIVSSIRRGLNPSGPLLFGAIVGGMPIIFYMLGAAIGSHPIEPALPLGLRALWRIGETGNFLLHGLPLLLGANGDPFLQLIRMGREDILGQPSELTAGMLRFANWLVAGGLALLALALISHNRRAFASWLRLEPSRGSPVTLLASGAAGLIGLYLLSGCAHDFNTIRYLIPLWAFLPGLLALAAFDRRETADESQTVATRAAFVTVLFCWAIGQFGLWQRLGAEHPLRPLAEQLKRDGVRSARADLFDAHLLSYLTGQSCRVSEFEPFWPRLEHYRGQPGGNAARYLVRGASRNWTNAWAASGFPGAAPPETDSSLGPAIARLLAESPDELVSRQAMACGFELVELKRPLPESGPTTSH